MIRVSTGDTPWNHLPIHGVGRGNMAAKASALLEELRKLGVVLPAGSRIERAISFLKQTNVEPERLLRDDHMAAVSREAGRTVFEFLIICWSLDSYVGGLDSVTLDRLRCFGKGADLPGLESNTTPRDTQFELLTAAYLLMGGAHIRVEEPDHTLLYHGRRVGVAVKRLTSLRPERVATVLSKAEKQIAKSTGKGFVALNLDSWLEGLGSGTPAEAAAMFNASVQEAHQKIHAASRRTPLLGTLAFGTWATWDSEPAGPRLRFKVIHQHVGSGRQNALEISQFAEFFEAFDSQLMKSMGEFGYALRFRGE